MEMTCVTLTHRGLKISGDIDLGHRKCWMTIWGVTPFWTVSQAADEIKSTVYADSNEIFMKGDSEVSKALFLDEGKNLVTQADSIRARMSFTYKSLDYDLTSIYLTKTGAIVDVDPVIRSKDVMPSMLQHLALERNENGELRVEKRYDNCVPNVLYDLIQEKVNEIVARMNPVTML